MLPGGAMVKPRPAQPKLSHAQKIAIQRTNSKLLGGVPLGKKAVITASGIRYVERTDYAPELDAPEELIEPAKPKRAPRPRYRNDPAYVAAARELRDRYLEEVNVDRMLPAAHGKYDVSRRLDAATSAMKIEPAPLLEHKIAG